MGEGGAAPVSPPFRAVAVLGLGVIGGSLVRALRAELPGTRIMGWSPALGERSAAVDAGLLDGAPAAWEDAVDEADLVVLATPLGACLQMLPELEGIMLGRATVMDVASLKAPVARVAEDAGLAHRWIGSHPMAGSEGTGFARSDGALFRGARVWLVAGPHAVIAGRLKAVERLWRAVGAEPALIEADDHDRLMALVSHLPQLVSNALASVLLGRGVAPEALGPGGRDMTRLAGSNPTMWRDLLRHAPAEVVDGLRSVRDALDDVARAVEGGAVDHLEKLMQETRSWRGERS